MKKIVSIAMLAGILSLAACHSEHSESVKVVWTTSIHILEM